MKRLFDLLLYLYPPSFRRAHGDEMRQFVRTVGRTARRGHVVWLTLDVLRSLPREWFEAARAPRLRDRRTPDPRPHAGALMPGFVHDIRHSARLLVKNPGFAAAAILTLALGIGANTAIFSLADATLLRPLDVADPDSLVAFSWSGSYPDYVDYEQRKDVFSGVIAVTGASRISITIDGASELRGAAFVSGNTFDVLGITAAAGRPLQLADDVPNAPTVAVLSYDYWQSQFGGRADAVGRVIQANGRPATIVGVAREGFRGTSLFAAPSLYFPVTSAMKIQTGLLARANVLTSRNLVWLTVIGRLRDDVSREQAESAMDTLYRQLHPPRGSRVPEALKLQPLTVRALGSSATSLRSFVLLLAGVVGLTLLIACANLANLLLAKSASRRREVGVRMALGAGRARVVRQMLAESLLLAMLGGAAGVFVSAVALRMLGTYELPGGIAIEQLGLGVNRVALLATAALSMVTGVLFGAAPAWRASRTDVMVSLRDDSRGATARSGLRNGLVAAQVAFSLVLLTGSGLFLRSLVHALNAPLGFTTDGVSLVSVNVGLARYDEARASEFYASTLERVSALPGVQAAGWSSTVPTTGEMLVMLQIEGYAPGEDEDMTFYAAHGGPGYFAAAGTRILSGRPFSVSDNRSAPSVVIVNEAAARKYWGGQPIGRRLKLGRQRTWATIVGVAENTTVEALNEETRPYVYFPFDQVIENAITVESAHLFVRTSGKAVDFLPLLAEQVRAFDPALPIYDVRAFDEVVRALVMPQRMGVTLLGFFSALALILATVGIYGVASYVAQLRTREIGVRMALGAGRGDILRLMLRQGARPVWLGIAAGLLFSLYSGQLASAFLYGVAPRDPVTLAAVAGLLGAVALGATYLPARRAAGVDPTTALRRE